MPDDHILSPTPPIADAYSPEQIALKVEAIGIRKAAAPVVPTVTLGVLAGAFIAFGAVFYTAAITGADAASGPVRILGGIAFSLGLILVVVAGAELFTGNNLIVLGWADGRITTRRVLRNWMLVYVANFIGAIATAFLVHWSGVCSNSGGGLGKTAIAIALAKTELGFSQAFFRGILCNTLVCLAVWLCLAAHDVTGKMLAIVFPITAFVALGFEHSVANMYLIPIAMLTGADITPSAFVANLVPVTLGNIVGGSVFVAIVYWLAYRLRPDRLS